MILLSFFVIMALETKKSEASKMVWFIVIATLVMIAEVFIIAVQQRKIKNVAAMEHELAVTKDELINTKAMLEALRTEFVAQETSKIEEEIKEAKAEAVAIKRDNEIRQTHLQEQIKLRENILD